MGRHRQSPVGEYDGIEYGRLPVNFVALTRRPRVLKTLRSCRLNQAEVVPVFVEFEVAVPHLRPAGW
jgi:hypothetical protein